MPCAQRPDCPSVLPASSGRRGAQRVVEVEHARRQPIVLARQIARDPEVPQQHLAVREGHGAGARRGAAIVVPLREHDRRLARVGGTRREGHAGEAAGLEADTLAQADHRVEHGAGRACQRAAVERDGRRHGAAAAEEPDAARLPLGLGRGVTVEAEDVECPGACLVNRSGTATADERRALGQVLGLHEELAERRMREVVGRAPEHDLGVARDVDLADAIAAIGQRQPPHLRVVSRRDHHLQHRLDAVVGPPEHRLVGREGHEAVFGLAHRREPGR